MASEDIRKVKIGDDVHEIRAKYLQDENGNQLSITDIKALVAEKANIEVLDALPTADATAWASYKNTFVFVPDSSAVSGTYEEYVIQRSGDSTSYSYRWESIGTTKADLVNYLQKNTNYADAALSAGSHSHTVTVPAIARDTTKKLGVSLTRNVAVGSTGDVSVLTNINGESTKLVTTTVTGVSGSSSKKFNTDAIKAASLTGDKTFTLKPTVDSNGVLSFTTGTVGISTTAAATDTITVPIADSTATTVATGTVSSTGKGSTVLVGLGSATVATAITGVCVTSQPEIAITESSSNSGPINEHITIGSATAGTTSSGAHTHSVKVSG